MAKAFNCGDAKAARNFQNCTNSVCTGKQLLLAMQITPENWNTARDLETGAKSGKEEKNRKFPLAHHGPTLVFSTHGVWKRFTESRGIMHKDEQGV